MLSLDTESAPPIRTRARDAVVLRELDVCPSESTILKTLRSNPKPN